MKHGTRHHTENHFKLQELVCGRQSTAVFEAGYLTVATISKERGEVALCQSRSAPQ